MFVDNAKSLRDLPKPKNDLVINYLSKSSSHLKIRLAVDGQSSRFASKWRGPVHGSLPPTGMKSVTVKKLRPDPENGMVSYLS